MLGVKVGRECEIAPLEAEHRGGQEAQPLEEPHDPLVSGLEAQDLPPPLGDLEERRVQVQEVAAPPAAKPV